MHDKYIGNVTHPHPQLALYSYSSNICAIPHCGLTPAPSTHNDYPQSNYKAVNETKP